MEEITVTPLEALAQLTDVAILIDTFECKDNGIYNRLQGALGVAQTVLAMAPKQEAPEQEPVAYLRFRAAQQWSGMGGHDIEHCECLETCQAHEVGDDKLPAFPGYAAPAAANGALTDERESFEAWAKEHLGQGYSLETEEHTYVNPVTRWAFVAFKAGRAALAAAGPDAALTEDAMRYRHLRDDECEVRAAQMIHAEGRLRFESYAGTLDRLIDEARAALSGAKGN